MCPIKLDTQPEPYSCQGAHQEMRRSKSPFTAIVRPIFGTLLYAEWIQVTKIIIVCLNKRWAIMQLSWSVCVLAIVEFLLNQWMNCYESLKSQPN